MSWKAYPGVTIGGLFWLAICCCFHVTIAPRPPARWDRTRELLERGRITEKTKTLRLSLLAQLSNWLGENLPEFTLDDLARYRIDSLSEWLEEYMIHLYLGGHTRQTAAETLNAVVQKYGWLRTVLAGPWNLVRTWESLEPSRHHSPIPRQVMFALAATALAWDWPKIAVLLVLGFFGLLRPSELIALRRSDLALPTDHWDGPVVYIRVGTPKTRSKAARDQHVRIDEPYIAQWITKILTSTPSWSRIWHGSLAAFKTRFNLLQTEVLQAQPFVPASLRPGGATFLFRLFHENLQRLQWRGRWRSYRMLEIYVQELGAAEVWVTFPPKVKAKVAVLGSSFFRLLQVSGLADESTL